MFCILLNGNFVVESEVMGKIFIQHLLYIHTLLLTDFKYLIFEKHDLSGEC
jgi:hypothetical protein